MSEADNRELVNETAEALLSRIKELAPEANYPNALALAEAYAKVREGMPRLASQSPGRVR